MINGADADAADGIAGGEPIQLLLKLAKHDFEYETFTLEEFGNADSDYHRRKAAGEFGTFAACGGGLPIYKENGKKYFETNAILRMLGAKHGFYSTVFCFYLIYLPRVYTPYCKLLKLLCCSALTCPFVRAHFFWDFGT